MILWIRADMRINTNHRRRIEMPGKSVWTEIWGFMKVRKKWWLGPIIVMMILIGALLIFAQTSALAPFIYAIF